MFSSAVVLLSFFHAVNAFSPLPMKARQKTSPQRRSFPSVSLSSSSNNENIRFLGRAENALVRPGVVLVAPIHEYNTHLRQSAVFVFAMGYDEHLDQDMIRAVVIDYPTPFTMGEMGVSSLEDSALKENLVYRGGPEGADSVLLLHSIPIRSEIGTSGIYEGGLQEVVSEKARPEQCKFFFNYCQFRVSELEDMLQDEQDGDAWVSVEVPPEMILNSEWERSELWKYLRNTISQQ